MIVILAVVAAANAPLVDRPLTLPAGTVQAQLAYEPSFFSLAGTSSTVHNAVVQVDAGVLRNLQLGIGASQELSPSSGFNWAGLRGIYALTEDVALRLDVGTWRMADPSLSQYGLLTGLGVSARFPLVPHLLVLGIGRTLGLPPIGPVGSPATADDIFVLDQNHSNDEASAGLPLTLTLQATPALAVAARGGYRYGWGGGAYTASFVPLGLDLVFSSGAFDVMITGELPGDTAHYFNTWVGRALIAARF